MSDWYKKPSKEDWDEVQAEEPVKAVALALMHIAGSLDRCAHQLQNLGLGNSSPSGFGALELLGMALKDSLGEINETLRDKP